MSLDETERAVIAEIESMGGFAVSIGDHGPLTGKALTSLKGKGVLRQYEEGWRIHHLKRDRHEQVGELP